MPLEANASSVDYINSLEAANKTNEDKLKCVKQTLANARDAPNKSKQQRSTSRYSGSLFRHVYEQRLGKKAL